MTSGTPRGIAWTVAVATALTLALASTPTSSARTTAGFTSSVQRIDKELKERMAFSWRKGCPVPRRALRYVTVSYVAFRGAVRQGELVVHRSVATDVVGVFEKLYDARFRVRRMRLVDDYRGSDAYSMAANNTSAFNCRRVSGTSRWSEHAYGTAIDLNPVQNPYVRGDYVAPIKGEAYVDRTRLRKGMVDDTVRDAFAAIGWGWGGTWKKVKDYQHFSASGR